MEPSFYGGDITNQDKGKPHDYVIVDKLTYHFRSPRRGDVIVFHEPQKYQSEGKLVIKKGQLLIKRIIGLPGDKVEIRDGEIYINDYQLQEKPHFGSIPYPDYSVTVPQGQYWVIGDNRGNTTGSHLFGPVPRNYIVGRVWITYWPRSDWGFSPKYSAGPLPATT